MHEETEKRDQLIHDLIKDRFRLEWYRTRDLDGKASGIIGFVGIIVSLQAGLGSFLLNEIPRTCEFYIHLCVLFLLGIIFLTCSILCGLKAYYVKTWKVTPDPEYLIEEYAKKDRNKIDILRIVSAEIAGTVAENKATNDEKAKFIRYGFIFLVFGIGMAIIFLGSLLIV
jgi:hypothetical protein